MSVFSDTEAQAVAYIKENLKDKKGILNMECPISGNTIMHVTECAQNNEVFLMLAGGDNNDMQAEQKLNCNYQFSHIIIG